MTFHPKPYRVSKCCRAKLVQLIGVVRCDKCLKEVQPHEAELTDNAQPDFKARAAGN